MVIKSLLLAWVNKAGEKVVTLAAKPRRPCPICGRPAVKAHRPFCSTRCADADRLAAAFAPSLARTSTAGELSC